MKQVPAEILAARCAVPEERIHEQIERDLAELQSILYPNTGDTQPQSVLMSPSTVVTCVSRDENKSIVLPMELRIDQDVMENHDMKRVGRFIDSVAGVLSKYWDV